MREDVVLPATARRLVQEGLAWEPQIGDWCSVLGAVHMGEGQSGLWLVTAIVPGSGLLGLVDAAGRWPQTRVPTHDCLWLPTAGKLKTWLRARSYRVTTGEASVPLLTASAPTLRHVCRVTHSSGAAPIDGEGLNEAEALADVVLRLLGASTADSQRVGW